MWPCAVDTTWRDVKIQLLTSLFDKKVMSNKAGVTEASFITDEREVAEKTKKRCSLDVRYDSPHT